MRSQKKVCQVPSGASAEIEILGKRWLEYLFWGQQFTCSQEQYSKKLQTSRNSLLA